MRRIELHVKGALSYPQPGSPKPPRRIRYNGRHEAQMSKVHAVLLVGVALIAMAAIGTLSLVVVTDVGYVAYQVLKPRANY